jgi:hypothetical protein
MRMATNPRDVRQYLRMPDDDELAAVLAGFSDAARAEALSFMAHLRGASQRSLSEVIAADEAGTLDADFDDAAWMALCGLVERRGDSIIGLPAGVRAYYSTRLIEWEVANGGFTQAVFNCGEHLDAAAHGYVLLGDEWSADLMRRAQAIGDDGSALDALDEEVDGPPWNGAPWSDETRVAYVRSHRDEFRL